MVHNMGMMSDLMKEMHQMLHEWKLTSEQQRQIADMMTQLGQMMEQMRTPQPGEVEERQHRHLTVMQGRLKALKKQVQKQNAGKE